RMKADQAFAQSHQQEIISRIEKTNQYTLNLEIEAIVLETEDVEIIPVHIPGCKLANSVAIAVALEARVSEELRNEVLPREVVKRIQNLRKDKGFEVTDKILVKNQEKTELNNAIKNNLGYICSETLTNDLQLVKELNPANAVTIEVDELIST